MVILVNPFAKHVDAVTNTTGTAGIDNIGLLTKLFETAEVHNEALVLVTS